MTNLEKYPNTADAVKAWNEYRATDNPDIGISDWLELDYIEPRPSSLLEAAKAASNWMARSDIHNIAGTVALGRLKAAIAAEEVRPKRNFERFATAKEAYKELSKMCRVRLCKACRFYKYKDHDFGVNSLCVVHWLYSSDPNLDRAEEKAEESDKLEGRK